MKEVEVKILEIDKGALRGKLKALGAKRVFSGPLEAYYYDYPDNQLYRGGKVLRLRRRGAQWELTFKEAVSKRNAKIMNEYEINLPKNHRLGEIMEGVGLKVYRKFKKHRESFLLAKVHFEIDTYPGIPPFLEVEAPDLSTVKKYVKKLGFSMSQAKPWSTYELFRHYHKK